MPALCQLDENLIPGQTYTFQLKLGNIITLPSTSTLQSDMQSNAPAFINNALQVTMASNASSLLPWNNFYNVQFTYNGDGSDVVSDVADSIVSAISQGSNDSFTFVGAVAANAASTDDVTGSITDAVQQALKNATAAVGGVAQDVTKSAAASAQNLLTPIEIALVLVVGLVVWVIFTSGKAGGVSASESGFKVGGAK